MRAATGHEVLAGAVGATSILGGAFTSPLWAPVVDLGSAAVTAGIAAHAVHSSRGPQADGPSTREVLRHAASEALKAPEAPLAAHVIDAACRARAFDTKALRSVAMLVGRCFEGHARGIALGLIGAWCAPIKNVSRVVDSGRVARAAQANAELVRVFRQGALALANGGEPSEQLPSFPLVPDFTYVTIFENVSDLEEAA